MKRARTAMNGFEHYIIDDSPMDRNRVIFNMLQWNSPNSRDCVRLIGSSSDRSFVISERKYLILVGQGQLHCAIVN